MMNKIIPTPNLKSKLLTFAFGGILLSSVLFNSAEAQTVNCITAQVITVNPLPGPGNTYTAGTTVNFCFTINGWTGGGAQYLHGIPIQLGAGWNAATLGPVLPMPLDCGGATPTGWGWFNSCTPTGLGIPTAWGPPYGKGFYYDGFSAGPAFNGIPGDNWGDGGNCNWTFCFSCQVNNPCVQGASLSVQLMALGDGYSGSWGGGTGWCVPVPISLCSATAQCCPTTLTFTQVNPTCNGACDGSATVTAANGMGPYTYSWNTVPVQTGVTATGLCAGTYTVDVTDASPCTVQGTVTIVDPPVLTVNVTPVDASCGSACDGSATAVAAGGTPGYSLTWTTVPVQSGTSASNLCVGAYSCNVVDLNGCTASANFNIGSGAFPPVTINPTSGSLCAGQSLSLTASAGIGAPTYSWAPAAGLNTTIGPSVIATPSFTTTYTVTANYNAACSDTETITIVVNPLPVLSVVPVNPAICFGQSVNLVVNGAPSITWNPNTSLTPAIGSNVMANPTSTITYAIIGTDAFGCTDSIFETVTVNPLPLVSVTPNLDTICSGNSTTLTANGAFSYTWLPVAGLSLPTGQTVTASPLITTIYTVTGTDANNCSNTDTAHIHVWPTPTSNFNATPLICMGVNATVTYTGTGTPTSTYTWNFAGANVVSGAGSGPYQINWSVPGIYTVTLDVSENNCPSTQTSHTVQVDSIPSSLFTVVPDTLCAGDVVSINYSTTAAPTASFAWNFNGAQIVSGPTPPINAGPYTLRWLIPGMKNVTLTVTSGACTSPSTSVPVFVAPAPVAGFVNLPTTACVPFMVQFTSNDTSAAVYLWDFGDGTTSTQQNPVHMYSISGSYNVKQYVASINGCPDSVYITAAVVALDPPIADFTAKPDTGVGIELQYATFEFTNLSQGATSYTWWFGDGTTSNALNPNHTYLSVGSYSVILLAQNAIGCADSIWHSPYIVTPNGNVFIPNAFTPNGDKQNDVFMIQSVQMKSGSMKVYDRWGELVYQTDDALHEGWDGTFQGSMMNNGVYIYIVKVTFMDDVEMTKKGDVTLFK